MTKHHPPSPPDPAEGKAPSASRKRRVDRGAAKEGDGRAYPPLSDRVYWTKVIDQGGLADIRIEILVRLFQDRTRDADRDVVEKILEHVLAQAAWLMDVMTGKKDHLVGGRRGVIQAGIDTISNALLAPDTPDGGHVRTRFWFVSKYRLLNEIDKAERRAKRISSVKSDVTAADRIYPWRGIEAQINVDRIIDATPKELDRTVLKLLLEGNSHKDIVKLLKLTNRHVISRVLTRVGKQFSPPSET